MKQILSFVTRTSAIADKLRDTFRGQSRSPNMVPFHMLCMVSSYCAIVTLSVGCTIFLEIWLQKMLWPWKPG